MKILTCFYLISILLYYCNAQTSIYHPFPESDVVWNYTATEPCWGSGLPMDHYSYILTGDTIINTLTYHKLFIPFVQQGCNGEITPGYKGSIRQDILEKKVYFIPHTEVTEYLLYDFNMAVGDTVEGYTMHPFYNDAEYWVQSIDSVLVGINYRKRWNIDTLCSNIKIIEGIGSTFGLIEQYKGCIIDGLFFDLNCFSQNGQTFYPDSNAYCEIVTSIEYIDEKPINIYPNPSNGSFYIHNYDNPYSKFDIEIVDLNGHILEITKNKGDANNLVFFFDIPDGLYFAKIAENGVLVKVEKLLIKH